VMQDLPGVDRLNDYGQMQELHMTRGCDPQQVLRSLLERAPLRSFDITKPSLHDIFVRIAGPEATQASATPTVKTAT